MKPIGRAPAIDKLAVFDGGMLARKEAACGDIFTTDECGRDVRLASDGIAGEGFAVFREEGVEDFKIA